MIFERNEFATLVGQPEAVGMIIAYTGCMFILYSLAPIMFRMGSAILVSTEQRLGGGGEEIGWTQSSRLMQEMIY